MQPRHFSSRSHSSSSTDLVPCRTVATKDDILVPETLLKKRKSQEKAREAKASEIKERRAVSRAFTSIPDWNLDNCDEDNHHATRLKCRCCRLVNHLSGLNRRITPTACDGCLLHKLTFMYAGQ